MNKKLSELRRINRLRIIKRQIIFDDFIFLKRRPVIFEPLFREKHNQIEKLITKDKHLLVNVFCSRPRCYKLFVLYAQC